MRVSKTTLQVSLLFTALDPSKKAIVPYKVDFVTNLRSWMHGLIEAPPKSYSDKISVWPMKMCIPARSESILRVRLNGSGSKRSSSVEYVARGYIKIEGVEETTDFTEPPIPPQLKLNLIANIVQPR